MILEVSLNDKRYINSTFYSCYLLLQLGLSSGFSPRPRLFLLSKSPPALWCGVVWRTHGHTTYFCSPGVATCPMNGFWLITNYRGGWVRSWGHLRGPYGGRQRGQGPCPCIIEGARGDDTETDRHTDTMSWSVHYMMIFDPCRKCLPTEEVKKERVDFKCWCVDVCTVLRN